MVFRTLELLFNISSNFYLYYPIPITHQPISLWPMKSTWEFFPCNSDTNKSKLLASWSDDHLFDLESATGSWNIEILKLIQTKQSIFIEFIFSKSSLILGHHDDSHHYVSGTWLNLLLVKTNAMFIVHSHLESQGYAPPLWHLFYCTYY